MLIMSKSQPMRYLKLDLTVSGKKISVRNKGGGQEGSDPLKSMRDPCKVVIYRDLGESHKNPLIVNCISYYLI